jgi:hypothetical protein
MLSNFGFQILPFIVIHVVSRRVESLMDEIDRLLAEASEIDLSHEIEAFSRFARASYPFFGLNLYNLL